MKSDKMSNFLGLCLLGAIAAAVVTYFIVKPLLADAAATKTKVVATNAEIEGLKKLDSDTKTLRQNYDAIKDRRDAILKQLPLKSEEERLLVLLSSFGQKTTVTLSSFSPSDNGSAVEGVTSVSAYRASVSISGKYAQIQDFLHMIEKSARFIDIESASFTSTGGGVTGGLNLQAYYQNTDAATGGAQ